MAQEADRSAGVLARDSEEGGLRARLAQFVEALDELKRFEGVVATSPANSGSGEDLQHARDILERSLRHHGRAISSIEMVRSLDQLPDGRSQEIAQAWQSVQEDAGDRQRAQEADRDSGRTD